MFSGLLEVVLFPSRLLSLSLVSSECSSDEWPPPLLSERIICYGFPVASQPARKCNGLFVKMLNTSLIVV